MDFPPRNGSATTIYRDPIFFLNKIYSLFDFFLQISKINILVFNTKPDYEN